MISCGTSCRDEDTQVDNNSELQFALCIVRLQCDTILLKKKAL